MNDAPRDWDRELADVDRMMAKQGSTPAGAPVPAPGSRAAPPMAPPAGARRSAALTWFWTLLALGMAIALPLWPYPRACGMQLFFFLGATGVTSLVALLGARASWASRRGFAHVLSLLVLAWAAVVALRDVLPRVGYARASQTWMCAAAAPAGPSPAAAPAPR